MNLEEKIRTLISSINLFTAKEIELIVEKTIVKEFKKGDVLLREGQIPTRCFMVVEGCVREYLIKEGVEKSTAFFTEGKTFTPHTHNGNASPSKHFWECTEDCILTISNQSFEEELRAAIPRLDAIFQNIAIEKLNAAKDEWSQFISSSPEERYKNLVDTNPTLFNRVPHHQIASYLGMEPQSLSRIRKRIFDSHATSLN